MKKQLNPTLTYVLSAVSLLCCCFGGLGFIPAGIAAYMASSKIKDATANPDEYEGNINSFNTAKIIALVVLAINVLYLLYTVYMIYTIGWDEMSSKWTEAMEQARQQQGQ